MGGCGAMARYSDALSYGWETLRVLCDVAAGSAPNVGPPLSAPGFAECRMDQATEA